ncbi:unnamed protein product [Durusdinium trenchii]|uniref:Uncharacterized protein n=1 Tax=Durusdinium trenchii TaxID=1381693 RepID=A0ABP0Q3T2_9DINO
MYLAQGSTIHGRCRLSPPLSITSESQFLKLKEKHKWDSEGLPYKLPFVVHAISQVQQLTPLEFLKLRGCQGRSLYRPLDWKPEHDLASTEGENLDSGETKADAKTGETGKGKDKKKGLSAKEKKAKAKAKITPLKVLPPEVLESQKVKIIDPAEHFVPGEERLQAKRKFFSRKDSTVDLHVSGGALAHVNNLAFPREGQKTAAYLFGEIDKVPAVQAVLVPAWSDQERFPEWDMDMACMQDCRFARDMKLLGILLVVPGEEKPDPSHLSLFQKLQKESLFFGLTGTDRKSAFYKFEEEHWKEKAVEVHWTGKKSHYMVNVVGQKVSLLENIKECARSSVDAFKKSLDASTRKGAKKQKKAEQNMKRRAQLQSEGEEQERPGSSSSLLRRAVEEIQSVVDYLVEKIAEFDQATASEGFLEHLALFPLAKREMSKVVSVDKGPKSVAEAGKYMSQVMNLKAILELRLARRQSNTSHTYDGNKWMRKRLRGDASSELQTVRRKLTFSDEARWYSSKQLCNQLLTAGEPPDSEQDSEEEREGRSHGNSFQSRNRPTIYQKLQALKEMDRLVESGKTHGLEKAVAQVFPNLFTGKNGLKSGMLGRWKTQAEQQKWYEIPFERLPEADRHWRELPDWVRVPLGLEPRSLERFKDGKNIPSCISKKLVEMLEKSTTGSATSNLTSGKLDLKLVKKDAEELLATYHQTQEEMAKELGMEAPPAKLKVSDRCGFAT